MRTAQRCTPFLIIFFLLIGCATPVAQAGKSNATTPTPSPTSPPATTTSGAQQRCPSGAMMSPSCLTPDALRQAYGITPLIQQGFTGKGQTVLDIVSFGSPTLQQDMNVYDQTFNLPPIDLQVISPLNEPENDPHNDKGGWAGETTLDVQIIHALAPDAKVIVLTSPVAETEGTFGLPEFRQLIQYAINHKLGNIVSQSWGASELTLQDAASQQELQQWTTLLQQSTTQQGMTYFSSSGDEGATDYRDDKQDLGNVAATSFAPDDPWVTSVGGTTLQSINNGSSFQETAWSDSGGGFSRFYPTPDYQKSLPAAVESMLNNRRGVPDVAADADPGTGLAIYEAGEWSMAGGTSAAAPVWSAITAIANQMAGHPLGFVNPGLYKLAASSTYNQDFHDITEGNNSNTQAGVQGYNAAPGWDPVTGLGSPNAVHLIPDLIAALK